MRLKIITSLCMLFFGALQANGQSFDIIRTTPQQDQFDKADSIFSNAYVQKDSVTAFNALAQLNRLGIQLHDKRLDLAAIDLKAEWYSANYHYNPRSLFLYNKAIGMARSDGFTFEAGYYTFRKALFYHRYGRYVLASENYLKAYDLFKSAGFSNIPYISFYLKDIAYFYYNLGDFETTKRFMLEALNNKPNHSDETDMTNTIGLIYRSNSEYDKALLYFNKALNIAKKYKDSVWIGITTGNIGSVYFMQGHYDQALPYIKTDYEQSVKYGQVDNAAIALLRLATINVDRGNFAAAESQLDTVAGLIKQPAANDLKQYITMYSLWTEIGEKTNRLLLAFEYQKKYAAAKDTLTKRDNILAVERIKLKWETDKNQARINELNAKARADAILRDGLAGILLLLIIITALLFNRQKIIVKRDQAALMLEKSLAEQERDKARLALMDYTDKLRQQNDLTETYKAELDNLQGKDDPSYQVRVIQLRDMLEDHIMTDKAWLEFKNLFDKVHIRFFSIIKSQYGDLTETDMRLLALIKLKLSNREMANMLGITIEGVKKSKQRLRKKTGLPEESNLEETIANI